MLLVFDIIILQACMLSGRMCRIVGYMQLDSHIGRKSKGLHVFRSVSVSIVVTPIMAFIINVNDGGT